ncbi:MAG: 30S ribosomal protein S12 methylthiotransferase RimO [Bacteroidetes bacterium]|uniref:Ribosomal protein uS12 methylthiotransferase RimO n=1 Tax=Candidatus Cryptobacteroides intestinigallinarum TaxID=2840767 RepID=A0A9D9N0K0_9BACT|nr:30S ribosomal protein S12 methylthiotransferase RimO [Candidatus Cryptobacteroides intestinigallinarum]
MSVKKTLQTLTLGCSKNRVDTEHILSQVEGLYDIVPESEEDASVDCLLINTCGFIGDAKEESVDAILEAVERKKEGKIGKIIVFGCLSQRYSGDLPGLIPEVDEWFGARDINPVIKALGAVPSASLRTSRHLTTPGHYAFLKISEGCDRRCSYCAIPHIRGHHRSVPMEDLVSEARQLADKGVRELIVIAQDTTYYGLDLYRRRALAELLQKLSEIDGIEWIRIHYSYPDDFPEDVLDQMADNPKVCRYMDIPLQHISDRVLANMRRNVDGAWTRNLIRTMRERVPGVVLRTTMIVGHPGESEEDFQELLDFIKEARFERLGAFRYSEEEGTYGAEHFKDEVPEEVKQERWDRLMEAQSLISLAFNQSRIDTETKVIIDDFTDGVFVCRSEFESPDVDGEILVKYDPVALSGAEPYSLIGEFMTVRITGADEYDLIGEPVSLCD